MLPRAAIALVLVASALGACNQGAADARVKTPTAPPAPRRFQSSEHALNGDERILLVDIPDPLGLYDRCVVYVNDKSGSSNMQCDFGGSLADR